MMMKPSKEHKIREWIEYYKENDTEHSFNQRLFYYFSDIALSPDFMRELVEHFLDNKQRKSLEQNCIYDWVEGIPLGDEFVSNWTAYVKNGLVKYVYELKNIFEVKE